MMTASNFHRIQTRTKTLQKHPGESAYALLRQLFRVNPSFSTLPMSLEWGHKNEKKAIRSYKKIARKIHRCFQFSSTGLCLCKENFFIGCSPDGVCFCKCPKNKNCPRRWLIEIKCPYIYRYSPVKLAAKENGCYYNRANNVWELSSTHKHYTQVQGLMGIMKYKHLDFAVYTTKGIVVIPVLFDRPFYERLVADLQYFQANFLFPHIIKMYV